MDKEQEELQSIRFFGIWRESFKTIYTWRKIFLQLSFALILPLYFIYFVQTEITQLFTQTILQTQTALAVNDDPTVTEMNTRSLLRELAWYLLVQISFIVLIFIFSLLSASAVIYTVACIYVRKNVTFKEIMCAIPKIWKRLMVTFLCVMFITFIYNFVVAFFLVFVFLAYPVDQNNIGKYLLPGVILSILYLAGVFYMGVVWQLANTVSVLEESYGFQALRKSKILMKGKMGISVGIYLVINICVGVAMHLFNNYVVLGLSNVGMFWRVGFGMMGLLLLCIINLVGLVVKTVFYVVCKSYQHEQIDKSSLVDHLNVYHGEGYVLLKPKGTDMEQV